MIDFLINAIVLSIITSLIWIIFYVKPWKNKTDSTKNDIGTPFQEYLAVYIERNRDAANIFETFLVRNKIDFKKVGMYKYKVYTKTDKMHYMNLSDIRKLIYEIRVECSDYYILYNVHSPRVSRFLRVESEIIYNYDDEKRCTLL